jgi:hypothetical protein
VALHAPNPLSSLERCTESLSIYIVARDTLLHVSRPGRSDLTLRSRDRFAEDVVSGRSIARLVMFPSNGLLLHIEKQVPSMCRGLDVWCSIHLEQS